MSLKFYRNIFWFSLVFFTIYPLYIVLNSSLLASGNPVIYLNAVQRILGLVAFNYLFLLIVLGSNMEWSVKLIGGQAFRFHILLGLVTYGFIFFHPLFYAASFVPLGGVAAFFSAIIPQKPENSFERGLILGQLSFVLITLAVIAGYFRTKITFLRKHWRKIHVLNYITFFMIALHALEVGSDLQSLSFLQILLYFQVSIVFLLLLRRIYLYTKANLGR